MPRVVFFTQEPLECNDDQGAWSHERQPRTHCVDDDAWVAIHVTYNSAAVKSSIAMSDRATVQIGRLKDEWEGVISLALNVGAPVCYIARHGHLARVNGVPNSHFKMGLITIPSACGALLLETRSSAKQQIRRPDSVYGRGAALLFPSSRYCFDI